jgi:hypothetical protein
MPATHKTARSDFEAELRDLWAQYISYVDRDGPSEKAKALRNRYYSLYRSYRNNQNWKKLITANP